MLKRSLTALIILGLILSAVSLAAQASSEAKLTAQEILDKAEQMNEADSRASDMTMILIDKKDKQNIRKVKIYTKGDDKRLIKFLAPADVKGVGFLVLNAGTDDEKMYLYLPAFKKVRRIAGSAKSGSFMGSDFSYDEISSNSYSDNYASKRLEDEDNQYVLEMTKKPTSDAEYDKLTMWVSKEIFVPTKIELYKTKKRNKEEYLELRKVMTADKIKQVANYWLPFEISMTDIKKKHKTVLELSNIKVDADVSDKFFTQRYLKR